MSSVSALPGEIVRWLSAQPDLSHITFLTEYPAIKKAVPLRKVIVAVGLQSVTLTDQFRDDGNGVLVRQEYCRTAAMRIQLAIHVPFSLGGHTCHEVFSDVTDALNFASNLHIEESGCENVTEDRDTDALVLKGYVQISADFCPAVSSNMNFQSFFDKELLCGTHIRDAELHASAAEKTQWNHPLIVSSYVGTGANSRTITLDFEPAWVQVFAFEYPPALYNAGAQRVEYYTAFAGRYGCQHGITLDGRTLRVYSDQSDYSGGMPKLNMAGCRYGIVTSR
ncbi:MAG: hypothetical protein IJT44_02660 [Clostridia bacterium]|nr:hypothetical protein [Clostridia bacterium]